MFSQFRNFKTMRALWIIPGLAVVAPVGAAELNGQAPGFLLHTPQITVVVRGGYSVPRLGGGGDAQSLWDFTKQHLTLENRDFAGSHIMVEVGIRGSERVDLVLALGHSPTSVVSEFREWEGGDGLPITQTTDFTTTPLTAGIKAYLKPRGRAIGSHVWVPRAFNPFVGIAGGGRQARSGRRGQGLPQARVHQVLRLQQRGQVLLLQRQHRSQGRTAWRQVVVVV